MDIIKDNDTFQNGGVLGEHEQLTSDELIILLSNEANAKTRGHNEESFAKVTKIIESKFEDFQEADAINSQVADYGTDEFEAGFTAGFKVATKLLIAGLK